MTVEPTVNVDERCLSIRSLEVRDPVVVDHALAASKNGGDLVHWVTASLGIGARALGSADIAHDAAEVRAGLDRLASDVTGTLTTRMDQVALRWENAATRSGDQVGTAVEQQVSRLARGIQVVLADTDDRMRTRVESILGEGLANLRMAVRDDAEQTRAAFAAGLAELRAFTAANDARAHVASRTHLVGAPFEAAARLELEALGPASGLLLEDTTTATGEIPHAKVGDFVLVESGSTSATARRIAVECKAGARLTSGRWQSLLDAAMRNRGAGAGLGIVPRAEALDGALLRVLSPTTAVVVLDPEIGDTGLLAATVSLLRVGALAQEQAVAGRTDVDVSALRDTVEGLVAGAESLAPIVRQAAGLRKSAGELHGSLDAARVELFSRISDLRDLLRGSALGEAA